MTLETAELAPALRTFLECGLILDPWLAGLVDEHFSFESQDVVARAADGLAGVHWREPLISRTLGGLPSLKSLGRRAVSEVATSTAAALAHERVGRISVDAAMAEEAVHRLERFIARVGFGPLVLIFLAVSVTESQGALAHYGRLSEEEFTSGARHRPWARGALDEELVAGLAAGNYRLEVRDGRRWVVATPGGRRLLSELRQTLADSGFFAERLRLTWVSHFNLTQGQHWDRLVASLLPHADALRLRFTGALALRPGMRVLDVGCGNGAQIVAGGVWKAVGAGGRVVGLDPAVSMLEAARRRVEAAGARNVRFVQGWAEALPFVRAEFDLTFALNTLELTDAPRALAEMTRVTRPGGAVVVHGISGGGLDNPVVRDWFRPVLRLAKGFGIDPGGRSGVYLRLPELFQAAGLTEVQAVRGELGLVLTDPVFTAQEVLQTNGFVQEVLERLPWAARQDVLHELVERGRAVCARTAPSARSLTLPTHTVRGTVPAAAG